MEKLFIGFCTGAFVILMAMRVASLAGERNQLAAQVTEQQRVITQLANRPTPAPIIVRVPVPVVSEPGPRWSVVFFLGAVVLVVGGVVVLGVMVGACQGRDPALHPGEPGFDEAANRAARAAGGVMTECEGVYWLTVPGREPARVVRLIEQRGAGDDRAIA